jgi:hypothetical protein
MLLVGLVPHQQLQCGELQGQDIVVVRRSVGWGKGAEGLLTAGLMVSLTSAGRSLFIVSSASVGGC